MNIKKDALKDAAEFARAKMFYGEGAGIRRNLIGETVRYKSAYIPGYEEAFNKALSKQNMAEHALKAQKERSRKDLSKKAARNTNALIKGKKGNLTLGVSIAVVGGAWAHEQGYDKIALEYTKDKVAATRKRYRVWKAKNEVYFL